MAVGKNISEKKKNVCPIIKRLDIKWGRGKGDENFGKENQDYKKKLGLERISSCREQPCLDYSGYFENIVDFFSCIRDRFCLKIPALDTFSNMSTFH